MLNNIFYLPQSKYSISDFCIIFNVVFPWIIISAVMVLGFDLFVSADFRYLSFLLYWKTCINRD